MVNIILKRVSNFLGEGAWVLSTYRGPILSFLTILFLYIVYKLTMKALRRYLLARVQKSEDVQNFLFIWRYVWFALIVIFALISFSGSIATLGISMAFLGTMLGWSLQAPITGIVAWLVIILKRPFKIGDRVIISGITGDVVDITLTHIHTWRCSIERR